jgi:hypothetical protein
MLNQICAANRVAAAVATACALLALLWAENAMAQGLCRPTISISQVRSMTGHWSGQVAAETASCATTRGSFYLKFVRTKENAFDLPFAEQFTWTKGRPTTVDLNLTPDEAVAEFQLGTAAFCPCQSSVASAVRSLVPQFDH